MIKMSILVPIYNVESYLSQCLDSLMNQTLKDIEIICVDDGSTDSSAQIAEEYAEKDTRILLIQKANSGYGSTMNVALRASRGEYIGIVESDDFAANDMFEKLYCTAKKFDADVVKSNFYEHLCVKGQEQDLYKEMLQGFPYGCLLTEQERRQLFTVTAQIWSAVYRREFLVRHQIVFHETPGASYQDTSFAFQVWLFAEKVVLEREAFLHYRIDNPESSIHSPKKLFCFCDEYTFIDELLERCPHNKEIEYIKTAIQFRDYLWNYSRIDGKYQYAFWLRFKEELERAQKLGLLKRYSFFRFPSVWDTLQKILMEGELFFEKTANCYRDKRITSLSENRRLYEEGFVSRLSREDRIIVYGAGSIGKTFVAWAEKKGKITIYSMAVTDIKDNPEQIRGIPVRSLPDLAREQENKGVLVVLAVTYLNQLEILQLLHSHGFFRCVSLDRELLQYCREDG